MEFIDSVRLFWYFQLLCPLPKKGIFTFAQIYLGATTILTRSFRSFPQIFSQRWNFWQVCHVLATLWSSTNWTNLQVQAERWINRHNTFSLLPNSLGTVFVTEISDMISKLSCTTKHLNVEMVFKRRWNKIIRMAKLNACTCINWASIRSDALNSKPPKIFHCKNIHIAQMLFASGLLWVAISAISCDKIRSTHANPRRLLSTECGCLLFSPYFTTVNTSHTTSYVHVQYGCRNGIVVGVGAVYSNMDMNMDVLGSSSSQLRRAHSMKYPAQKTHSHSNSHWQHCVYKYKPSIAIRW